MIDNRFSETWCEVFLRGMPKAETRREIEFVQRHMPRPEYSRLLDVAILDVYNRDHAITRPGLERTERGGVSIETRRTWRGPRLSLELWYDGVLGDRFGWHIYSPEELQAVCRGAGFDVLLTCAWLDEAIPASPAHARMQLLLERR